MHVIIRNICFLHKWSLSEKRRRHEVQGGIDRHGIPLWSECHLKRFFSHNFPKNITLSVPIPIATPPVVCTVYVRNGSMPEKLMLNKSGTNVSVTECEYNYEITTYGFYTITYKLSYICFTGWKALQFTTNNGKNLVTFYMTLCIHSSTHFGFTTITIIVYTSITTK